MTTAQAPDTDRSTDRAALQGAFQVLGESLQRYASDGVGHGPPPSDSQPAVSGDSALGHVVRKFHLTPFECDILLLAAGAELDDSIKGLIAACRGEGASPVPTYALALAALPDADWSALGANATLRRAQLIRLGSGTSLTSRPLHIRESVLHYLIGLPYLDENVRAFVDPLPHAPFLTNRQVRLAARIAQTWGELSTDADRPSIQVAGRDVRTAAALAVEGCAAVGLTCFKLDIDGWPVYAAESDQVMQVWEREAVLHDLALFIDLSAVRDQEHSAMLNRLIERLRGFVLLGGHATERTWTRPTVRIDLPSPDAAEQRELWRLALDGGAHEVNDAIERAAEQFRLEPSAVQDVAVNLKASVSDGHGDQFANDLWEACRVEARSGLDALAARIETLATWDDLVLGDTQMRTLHDVALNIRHRTKVYETWGFGRKSARGLGITALFWGASGTGKTLAAEVLAREIANAPGDDGRKHLDLYRIDLSATVSKYIGETEKNLRRIFDCAEESGAILLFDEADALFGKRGAVRDSHDRYANVEVSYLLQRMEAYRGLCILTTNLKNAIDEAFLRRIRFVVHFPFPSVEHRARIWRRAFPEETPVDGLDIDKLARLSIPGGNIRNIALAAAFLAAGEQQPVSMRHLFHATRGEFAKIEKPLRTAEVEGWD